MNCPCMGCENRVADPSCHETCQLYRDFRKMRNDLLKNKEKENMADYYKKKRKYS